MRVVIVEPGKPARIAEIEYSLESCQKVVGGSVECYDNFAEDCMIVGICEGELGCEPIMNRAIAPPDDKVRDVICGTFFICAVSAESKEFESLTDEQAVYYAEMFKTPHTFKMNDNGLEIIGF